MVHPRWMVCFFLFLFIVLITAFLDYERIGVMPSLAVRLSGYDDLYDTLARACARVLEKSKVILPYQIFIGGNIKISENRHFCRHHNCDAKRAKNSSASCDLKPSRVAPVRNPIFHPSSAERFVFFPRIKNTTDSQSSSNHTLNGSHFIEPVSQAAGNQQPAHPSAIVQDQLVDVQRLFGLFEFLCVPCRYCGIIAICDCDCNRHIDKPNWKTCQRPTRKSNVSCALDGWNWKMTIERTTKMK